ncbi:MAG: glycosyltransferase family 39 protein [Dehalococcoidia bacterium]|nr:glycosyltransferase family 39 protein [Dehalococcoidia bacterium]
MQNTQVAPSAKPLAPVKWAALLWRVTPVVLGLAAFFIVLLVSHTVFPYLSTDHDEGAYIFHAQMLENGKLWIEPGPFSEFFNAWLIVNDGSKIYPIHSPIFPAILAVFNGLFKDMRVALAFIAAAAVIAQYFVVLELYNRPVALVAALFLMLSPLFVVQASTFLYYIPTFLFNLLSLLLLLKALRRGGWLHPLLAGIFMGIAAFLHPYTALLFAFPAIAYVLYLLLRTRVPFRTIALIMAGTVPPFALMLGYNYLLTGNPFLFPYNVYGPEDTLGFGLHGLGSPSGPGPFVVHTPSRALDGIGLNLTAMTVWVFGGAALYFLILVTLLSRRIQFPGLFMLSLAGSIALGYSYYWGIVPLNAAGLPDPILSAIGPRYYVDILLPLTTLGAYGLFKGLHSLRHAFRRVQRQNPLKKSSYAWNVWRTVALGLVLALPVLGIDALLVRNALAVNEQVASKNRAIYAPFTTRKFDQALVFLPIPYGPFIHHPLSYLINAPSFNGPVVFAANRGNDNLRLIDAMGGRTPYYFRYAGTWGTDWALASGDIPNTTLVPLALIEGKSIVIEGEIKNPSNKPYVVAYVWNQEKTNNYLLDDASTLGKTHQFRWRLTSQEIIFEGPHKGQSGGVSLSTTTTLNFAIAFSDTPEQETRSIYEERFWFDIQNDRIRIVTPGEMWQNLNPPSSPWLEKDIAPVMRVSVRAQG